VILPPKHGVYANRLLDEYFSFSRPLWEKILFKQRMKEAQRNK